MAGIFFLEGNKKGAGNQAQLRHVSACRNSLVIISSQIDMDLQTAKNDVRSARIAWHATIGIDVANEYEAILKLDRAIEALQVWLPDYDPKATDTYGADP